MGRAVVSSVHRVTLPPAWTSRDNSRLSVAYFVAPEYDAVMIQPRHLVDDPDPDEAQDSAASISYSNWRKQRIKQAQKAMQIR